MTVGRLSQAAARCYVATSGGAAGGRRPVLILCTYD